MSDDPSEDGKAELRKEIARANGFELFKKYNESDAAKHLGVHPRTLKQMRLDGKVDCVRLGPRKISYFGFQIADIMVESIQWASPVTSVSRSANTGSARRA
ncbi:MAG: hypothetical protein AAFV54_12385, partial [Pseudomonadota bacterium]